MSSDRIFQQDQQWYFRIRGNAVKGPFASHHEAEMRLTRYVAARRRATHQRPALTFRWTKARSRAGESPRGGLSAEAS
jgi:hypothetical protein